MHKATFQLNIIFIVCALLTLNTSALPLSSKGGKYTNNFVGFYVFPHGGVTLDPEHMDYSKQPGFDKVDSKASAIKLHNAMNKAADSLIQSNPDVVIFTTPHGFSLADNLLFLGKSPLYGSVGGIWENFTAHVDIDKGLTNVVCNELKLKGHKAETLVQLSEAPDTASLQWAEVIPWNFIREAAKRAGQKPPKGIYIGMPARINTKVLTNYGRDIVKTVLTRKEFSEKRISVVVSGDLSHFHSRDPASPYPFDPISSVFDEYIVSWAKLDRQPEKESESKTLIWSRAGMIQKQAGHCAFSGLLMLHGMMQEMVQQGWNFKSNFYAYEIPSYFGMMVVSWTPVKKL